jgi:hypothetical protein
MTIFCLLLRWRTCWYDRIGDFSWVYQDITYDTNRNPLENSNSRPCWRSDPRIVFNPIIIVIDYYHQTESQYNPKDVIPVHVCVFAPLSVGNGTELTVIFRPFRTRHLSKLRSQTEHITYSDPLRLLPHNSQRLLDFTVTSSPRWSIRACGLVRKVIFVAPASVTHPKSF